MRKYIIRVEKADQKYIFGREWLPEERAAALDVLQALYRMKLIDSYQIKEVNSFESTF